MHRERWGWEVSAKENNHISIQKSSERGYSFSQLGSLLTLKKKCHRKTIFTVVRHQGTESYGSTGT